MTQITNLQDSPQYINQALTLIEKSFNYEENQKFDVDFYPLFNEDNFHQCYVLIEDNKVIGHIGCIQREFKLKTIHPINMFGGIAIADEYQGKGNFKSFFNKVMQKHSEVALSFLWSDKLSLYEKINFFPCVNLIQYKEIEEPQLIAKTLDCLSPAELKSLMKLYTSNEEIRITRTSEDWLKLTQIKSAEIYLMREGDRISNYFIKNKGQDLQGIIHEYGHIDENSLKVMIAHGTVWTPFISADDHKCQQLYGSIARIGNQENFEAFLHEFAQIKLITLEEKNISIQIGTEEFSLSQKDFLSGLLGPNKFSEINSPPLFISGLDSI